MDHNTIKIQPTMLTDITLITYLFTGELRYILIKSEGWIEDLSLRPLGACFFSAGV